MGESWQSAGLTKSSRATWSQVRTPSFLCEPLLNICALCELSTTTKKPNTDTPMPYFASWHVLHWSQMQSCTHEGYNQASEQWLTLQTFIRMFPQTQTRQHLISATSRNWLRRPLFFLMCACPFSAWGGDAGMKQIHSRYQRFQCMCQVGIRKCCNGPHEPILPPPPQQNLVVKSPTCPRAAACFATWPKHSRTLVGRRKENKKVSLHV